MKILTMLISFLFIKAASAGILIEPQLGYILSSKYSGTATLSGPAAGTLTANYSASMPEYGARLGYQSFGFMTGLNYGSSSASSKTIGSTTGSLKTTNLGAFVGYNAPLLLRAWLAYNFSAKTTIGTSEFKGSSTELGVGFTGVPFLSFNLIYRMYDYTKVTMSGLTFTATNFTPKEIEFAISAPFNLF